jgi:anti-sigma factor RsiW
MSQKMASLETLACREVRRRLPALLAAREARVVPIRQALAGAERAATERHLEACERCAMEYRLLSLHRATLDAAAAPEPIAPDEDFFKAVRARINRNEASPERADESWAAALLITARQLIPAMALLLLLIIGATFLWNNAAPHADQRLQGANHLPRLNDDPAPSVDDALESVMTVEEKKNGK